MATDKLQRLARTATLAQASVNDRFKQADSALLKGAPPAAIIPAEPAVTLVKPSIPSTEYRVGETYDVPLHLIREYKYNARNYYTSGEIDKMSTSLQQNTQEVDAIGFYDAGYVYLIEGQMRWRGCLSGGISALKVKFTQKPESPKESYLKSRRINLERSAQTALDDAVRWKQLLDEGVFESQRDLADSVGLTEGAISKTMAINRIPEHVRIKMLDHAPLRTLRGANAMSTIFTDNDTRSEEDQQKLANEVLEYVATHEVSTGQVEKFVASKIEGRKTRNRFDVIPIKYAGLKGDLKVNEAAGKLEFKIGNLPADKLIELQAKVRALFQET